MRQRPPPTPAQNAQMQALAPGAPAFAASADVAGRAKQAQPKRKKTPPLLSFAHVNPPLRR